MFGAETSPEVPDLDPRGFPSPARDYANGGIDLNRHLIRDRTCTFIMRVTGESMAGAGISDGDEIIVDRALTPQESSVVVAVQEGELLIRRLSRGPHGTSLATEPIIGVGLPESTPLGEGSIWGVVTRCLHYV